MTLRPYNDPEYRAAKAHLAVVWVPCQLQLDGCTERATSPDHQPPLAEHRHVRGTNCCRLVPACHHCNTSSGAATGNRNRHGNALGL